jgi:voltage-gated potassium channel Kch
VGAPVSRPPPALPSGRTKVVLPNGRRRIRELLRERERELVALTALVALGLGTWGFAELDQRPFLSDLYRSLQLFALESGAVTPEPGWQLNVARFLAPAVTGYAIVRAVLLVLRERMRSLALRRAANHVLVAGLGAEGVQLARAFADAGERVIAFGDDPPLTALQACEASGVLAFAASVSEPEAFARMRVERAKYVFVLCPTDARSIEAGDAAFEAAKARRAGVNIFVRIADAQLRIHVAANALARRSPGGPVLDVFDPFDVAARTLVGAGDGFPEPSARASAPPRVLVAGLDSMGQALVLHLARAWEQRREAVGSRLPLTVVDPRAPAVTGRLRATYPELDELCELDVRDESLERPEWLEGAPLLDVEGRPRVDSVFICAEHEEGAISPALVAHHHLRGSDIPITVCVSGASHTLNAALDDLADPPHPRIYSVSEEALSPEIVLHGTRELLARATHEDYLRSQLARGQRLGARRSLVPWEQLPPDLQASNRAQADQTVVKLDQLDCAVVPAVFHGPRDSRVEFSPEEIDLLAEAEHERWMHERTTAGWTRGPAEDGGRKTHPSMVAWSELSDAEKDKDRQAVRDLPRRLERAGFAVVRG